MGILLSAALLLAPLASAAAPEIPSDFRTPPREFLDGTKTRERDYEIRGARYHAVESGPEKGPVLLLIHGYADTWYGWRGQIPAWSKKFRVVAIDLPGYDRSPAFADSARYRPEEIARDLAALIDRLRSPKVYAIGHDLGGWIAWTLAMNHGDKLQGLVAVSAPHPGAYARALARDPAQKKASAYVEKIRDPAFPPPTAAELASWIPERREQPLYREAFARSSIPAMLEYYRRLDLEPRSAEPDETGGFPRVTVPVLEIHGALDEQILPATAARTKAEAIDQLELQIWPEVRHDPQRERAQDLALAVVRWIDGVPPATMPPERAESCAPWGQKKLCRRELSAWAPDGYRMKSADLDGDGLPDLLHIGGPVAWVSSKDGNPYFVSTAVARDFIDVAPYDLDGDGRPEIAAISEFKFIAGRKPEGGVLELFSAPSDPKMPWRRTVLGAEPTLHRLAWADLRGEGKRALIGAPLFSPEATGLAGGPPARLLLWDSPARDGPWSRRVIDETLHGIHGLELVDWNGDGRDDLLTASSEGVTLFETLPAEKGALPKFKKTLLAAGDRSRALLTGAGEVSLAKDRSFFATIEPWHGDRLRVYARDPKAPEKWKSETLLATSSGGHAVLALDLDGDGADEVVGCFFGKEPGVFVFRREKKTWKKALAIPAPFDCQGLLPFGRGFIAISDVAAKMIRVEAR